MRVAQLSREIGVVLIFIALALWLRWPTLGFSLWNVDESIHAAAARAILDGGVFYRDAIDIRHPLTYYAVAGIFAAFGENNLWAVRCLVAVLVGGTGWFLFLAGRALRNALAGAVAGFLYVALATAALFQGDANAANTEWFVAFFSSAAAAIFLTGKSAPGRRRLLATGAVSSLAFLSKQPALLDFGAPLAAVVGFTWWQGLSLRAAAAQIGLLVAGWLVPVLAVVAFFAAHGALGDAVFFSWIYNLTYYGPEITTADRVTALAGPFKLLGGSAAGGWVVLWSAGAVAAIYRLVQRAPSAEETQTNSGLLFVAVWSLTGLVGAASSGRSFDHYTIQFLAPFCLGSGWVAAGLIGAQWPASLRWASRKLAVIAVGAMLVAAGVAASHARDRTLPEDPSHRIAAYIRNHTQPEDRIFVWGFHPDIYLYADRQPASRYLFGAFQTGMIPWTNVAPEIDTSYAIVPGTMARLLTDLGAQSPKFIVDCSAGPNRSWQKYPLEKYPPLHDFIRANYRLIEGHQFGPQGFRLFQLRLPGEAADEALALPPLPPETTSSLGLGTVGEVLIPTFASARHGTNVSMVEGRQELFAHAPAVFRYRLPAGARALRGGFGFKEGAYAADNPTPTDGAEFIIRWRPAGGGEHILLHRELRPRDATGDRGVQSFRVEFGPHAGGELELAITAGPSDIASCDWTFWTDLLLENYR